MIDDTNHKYPKLRYTLESWPLINKRKYTYKPSILWFYVSFRKCMIEGRFFIRAINQFSLVRCFLLVAQNGRMSYLTREFSFHNSSFCRRRLLFQIQRLSKKIFHDILANHFHDRLVQVHSKTRQSLSKQLRIHDAILPRHGRYHTNLRQPSKIVLDRGRALRCLLQNLEQQPDQVRAGDGENQQVLWRLVLRLHDPAHGHLPSHLKKPLESFQHFLARCSWRWDQRIPICKLAPKNPTPEVFRGILRIILGGNTSLILGDSQLALNGRDLNLPGSKRRFKKNYTNRKFNVFNHFNGLPCDLEDSGAL